MDKERVVRNVFNTVANKYDLMNNLMSLGLHHSWKRHMVNILQPQSNEVLLDIAGGTGDIARAFLDKGGKRAMICDINHKMIASGICQRASHDSLHFICGNAESLPFSDEIFDTCSLAFGIRNMSNMSKAVTEALRVLKPMGKFVCMEFINCDPSLFQKVYDFYSYKIIPGLGKLVVGDKQSYKYLADSIRSFPKLPLFTEILRKSGLESVNVCTLFPPVVAIYWGYKV